MRHPPVTTNHHRGCMSAIEPDFVNNKRGRHLRLAAQSRISARSDHCPFDYTVASRSELVRRFNVESNNEFLWHTDGIEPKIPPAN